MAAPAYRTDLVLIDNCDAIGSWTEPTAANWTDGDPPEVDTDYPYIQGAGAVSQETNKAAVAAMILPIAITRDIPTIKRLFNP